MKDMDKRLRGLSSEAQSSRRRLNEAEREYFVALCAAADGSATLEQYQIVMARDAKVELKRWSPTVSIGRARRQLGLDIGWRHPAGESRFFIGDVLAHHPDETLSPELAEGLARYRECLAADESDPDERFVAAEVLLAIGPGDGWSGRTAAWSRCANKSKQICNHQCWPNAGLLNVWPQLSASLADRAAATPSQDESFFTSYEGFEALLWDEFG